MLAIPYSGAMAAITLLWILVRGCFARKNGAIHWKREAQLLLVYICLIVVVRFTFFPFSKVGGKVQPLIFDAANWFPFRINWVPFVNLMDYPEKREAWINIIGNTAMFIPLGIVWPSVFRELDTHWKAVAAGVGVSLFIELVQLPFYVRVSDVDDLILNSLGYLAGYGIYLLVKKCRKNASA